MCTVFSHLDRNDAIAACDLLSIAVHLWWNAGLFAHGFGH